MAATRRTSKKATDAIEKIQPACGHCHWCEPADEGYGHCFRNPPTPALDEDGGITSIRPAVQNGDRACAHFIGKQ